MTQFSGIQKNLANYEISVGKQAFSSKDFQSREQLPQMVLAKPSRRLFSLESHSACLIKDKYNTKKKG